MAHLVLFGSEYEVQEDSVLYNDYRAIFYKEAYAAQKSLSDAFKAEELASRDDFDKIVETGRGLLNNALAKVVAELTEREIYEYSVDSLKRTAVEPLTKFEDAATNVYDQLKAIDIELQQAEAARQAEIDSASSSWSGGGFGLEGALAGAAQAALLNAASGAVTSLVTSGEGKRARNAHETKIFNLLNGSETVKNVCSALYDDVFFLVKTFVKILKEDKGENIRVVTDEDILKSNDIFNNIKSGVYKAKPEVEKQMWVKTLSTFPYNIDYFILLLNTYEECFDEIKTLIEWYNLPMDRIADTLLADKYSFDGITELEEAQNQKAQLLKELDKYGVTESSLTDVADSKIEEILVQRRTYDGVTYETEEDCGYATELDTKQQEAVSAVDKADLAALIDLYTGFINSEDVEKYAEVCTKNAIALQAPITEAIKAATSAEELAAHKEKLTSANNTQISEALVKQIDNKIKSLNMGAKINETKDKALDAAKGLFGKAKGMFKK